jgi:hypothetical protein
MKQRGLPVLDLLAAHTADFALFKGEAKDYLSRLWVGHYNPRGNFFCAQAILPRLIEMLDPKPLPYRRDPGVMK